MRGKRPIPILSQKTLMRGESKQQGQEQGDIFGYQGDNREEQGEEGRPT